MPRPPFLAAAIVIATLLAAPAALAPAASPEAGTTVSIELKLKASNGLQAQLKTSWLPTGGL